jgi:ribulose-5-phosphate 4-epimerase/fuculose-1-phosphate aldolase
MSDEQALRHDLVRLAKSLFDRGLTPGASGNISVRCGDELLCTPTNSCLGFLEAARISKVSMTGEHMSGDPPTKEMPLHLAIYAARPSARAVAHLHSTYATLLSCLASTDPDDAIAPITPYVVMRVGRVAVIPYVKPGDPAIVPLIRAKAPDHPALLLANHGPVVAGLSLEGAVHALEELEETAKLTILSQGLRVNTLTTDEVADLERSFKLK